MSTDKVAREVLSDEDYAQALTVPWKPGTSLRSRMNAAYQIGIKRAIPEGYVLVPVDPTWAMTNAADDALGGSSFHDINKTYTAMITAAQEGK